MFVLHKNRPWTRLFPLLAGVIALSIAPISLADDDQAVQAEVQIKQMPLTWRQAALTDGEDLYVELCAVCHGVSGEGDGPAVPALRQPMPNLATLAAHNDGVFPRELIERYINGKARVDAHGTVDMPIWGRAFEYTKPDWGRVRRMAFARHRIYNIVEYIETLQVSVGE